LLKVMSHEGEGEHNMMPRDGPCSLFRVAIVNGICFAAGKELKISIKKINCGAIRYQILESGVSTFHKLIQQDLRMHSL
jgi:hypothetical protein